MVAGPPSSVDPGAAEVAADAPAGPDAVEAVPLPADARNDRSALVAENAPEDAAMVEAIVIDPNGFHALPLPNVGIHSVVGIANGSETWVGADADSDAAIAGAPAGLADCHGKVATGGPLDLAATSAGSVDRELAAATAAATAAADPAGVNANAAGSPEPAAATAGADTTVGGEAAAVAALGRAMVAHGASLVVTGVGAVEGTVEPPATGPAAAACESMGRGVGCTDGVNGGREVPRPADCIVLPVMPATAGRPAVAAVAAAGRTATTGRATPTGLTSGLAGLEFLVTTAGGVAAAPEGFAIALVSCARFPLGKDGATTGAVAGEAGGAAVALFERPPDGGTTGVMLVPVAVALGLGRACDCGPVGASRPAAPPPLLLVLAGSAPLGVVAALVLDLAETTGADGSATTASRSSSARPVRRRRRRLRRRPPRRPSPLRSESSSSPLSSSEDARSSVSTAGDAGGSCAGGAGAGSTTGSSTIAGWESSRCCLFPTPEPCAIDGLQALPASATY